MTNRQTDLFASAPERNWSLPVGTRLELIEGFLPADLHAGLFQQLRESLQWEQSRIRIAGRSISIPRLNAWYGDADSRYSYSGTLFKPLPWTRTLLELRGEIERACGARFNSVLANLYRDGRDSVAWHADDEPELGPEPLIASLSLGATRRFRLKHRRDPSIPRIDTELADNTLLIMGGRLQHDWFHQVPKTRRPVAARINLTFRWILPSD